MFLQARGASGARLTLEDGSNRNESHREGMPSFTPAQSYSQPEFEIINYSPDTSLSTSQFSGISTLFPDIHTSGHTPSPDSFHDSLCDSLSRGSRSISNNSQSKSGRLVHESSSLHLASEDFGRVPIASSDLERYLYEVNGEPTAFNSISGPGETQQASSQYYDEVLDFNCWPLGVECSQTL
jgi:hypothetical protein